MMGNPSVFRAIILLPVLLGKLCDCSRLRDQGEGRRASIEYLLTCNNGYQELYMYSQRNPHCPLEIESGYENTEKVARKSINDLNSTICIEINMMVNF